MGFLSLVQRKMVAKHLYNVKYIQYNIALILILIVTQEVVWIL